MWNLSREYEANKLESLHHFEERKQRLLTGQPELDKLLTSEYGVTLYHAFISYTALIVGRTLSIEIPKEARMKLGDFFMAVYVEDWYTDSLPIGERQDAIKYLIDKLTDRQPEKRNATLDAILELAHNTLDDGLEGIVSNIITTLEKQLSLYKRPCYKKFAELSEEVGKQVGQIIYKILEPYLNIDEKRKAKLKRFLENISPAGDLLENLFDIKEDERILGIKLGWPARICYLARVAKLGVKISILAKERAPYLCAASVIGIWKVKQDINQILEKQKKTRD